MISGLFRVAALAVAGWLIARWIRGATRPATAGRPGEHARGGVMVRDRVCNTFLPQTSALAERVGGETHYFCSESCRLRFLGGNPS